MSGNYKFKGVVHVWPHSTGKGQEADQESAGERVREVIVRANTLREALEKVELYRDGIETGPMVWQAPIQSVEQIRD